MEKMAIFVEGQTEQVFAEKLVFAVAQPRHVHVDAVRALGGRAFSRHFIEVHASRPGPSAEFYGIIYDSSNDSRVLSDIRDNYDNLVSQGYREILAIRDVFPLPAADIPVIRADFTTLAPHGPIAPLLALSVMEIEAWFIAEHTHFPKLDASLTLPAVTSELGYDPSTHQVELIAHPSADLGRAYALAGLGYNKSRRHVQRTVDVLDYSACFCDLPTRIPDVRSLVERLDHFFSL